MSDLALFDVGDDDVISKEFVVDSLSKAEWCLTQKGRAQAEIDRFTAMAEKLKADYCARIDERLAEIVNYPTRTLETMTDFLRPWATVEVAKAGGKKSMKLLSGTVGFRQSPSRLDVTDEAASVAWLKENGHADCVRTKEEVKKAETKKAIEASGEVPDGATLVPGAINFYADPLLKALESK